MAAVVGVVVGVVEGELATVVGGELATVTVVTLVTEDTPTGDVASDTGA